MSLGGSQGALGKDQRVSKLPTALDATGGVVKGQLAAAALGKHSHSQQREPKSLSGVLTHVFALAPPHANAVPRDAEDLHRESAWLIGDNRLEARPEDRVARCIDGPCGDRTVQLAALQGMWRCKDTESARRSRTNSHGGG